MKPRSVLMGLLFLAVSSLASAQDTNSGYVGGIGFGLGALGGLEYFVSSEMGVFGEARLDLLFAGGYTLPLIGLAVGANVYF